MAATATVSASPLPLPHVDGVEHRFLDVRGARLHVAQAGEGDPLVLLHGWPQHWWMWREVLPALAERHRVICPDLRGLGWSSGASGDLGWDGLAADVIGLLDALDLDRARVVGHDWGAVAGYRAALRWPERIARFASLGVIHPWQGWDAVRSALRRGGPWHIPAIAALGPAGITRLDLVERALRAWRHAGAFTADEAAVYVGAARRPASLEAAARFYRAVTVREIPSLIAQARHLRLEVPTLHLYGERDPLTPYRSQSHRPYADDMTVATVPGCGHFIAEEAPDALLHRLDAFL